MRKIYLLLVIGIFAIGISGCSQKEYGMSNHENTKDLPIWTMNPKLDGYVVAVGSAQKNRANDLIFQQTEAMAEAMDRLAKQIQANIDGLLRQYKSTSGYNKGKTYNTSTDNITRITTNITLKDMEIKDLWITKEGTMYVMVGIKDSIVDEYYKNLFDSKNEYEEFLKWKASNQ